MKKIVILILCLIFALSLVACQNNKDNSSGKSADDSLQTTAGDGVEDATNEQSVNSSSTNAENNQMPNQPAAQSVYVVKNFLAVEGAVIYDQTYDEYGYPDCCYFHKKCEACGDVSNNNGSARGNLTTSYYCPKCKTSNQVEIKADSEWIEVNK